MYTSIYISEVNTKYLLEANRWQKGIRKDDYQKDVDTVGRYMRDKFIKAFQEDPNGSWQIRVTTHPVRAEVSKHGRCGSSFDTSGRAAAEPHDHANLR